MSNKIFDGKYTLEQLRQNFVLLQAETIEIPRMWLLELILLAQESEKLKQEKPTVEQVAWVFEKINECWKLDGTFRKLIYDIMGFEQSAYVKLYKSGGQNITNSIPRNEEV